MMKSDWVARVFAILTPCLLLHVPCHARSQDDTKILRQQMLDDLQRHNFFLTATCRQIANRILEQNGLPPLGSTAIVAQGRGIVDRTREQLNPPVFKDEIRASTENAQDTKITASAHDGNWDLAIDREFKVSYAAKEFSNIAVHTEYQFKSSGTHGESCDFVAIQFTAKQDKGVSAHVSREVHLNDCFDLFSTLAVPPDFARFSDPIEIEENLKADCAFGAHYSLEAKNALSLEP